MKKILLIDEEPAARASLLKELEANGWTVLEASDGVVGLQIALDKKPDVVVCDLLMTRTNGFQVCRSLRAQPNLFRDGKIIVTSNSGYESDRRNAIQAGADEYLLKPLRAEQLLKILDGYQMDGDGDGADGTARLPQLPRSKRRGIYLKFWGVRGSVPTPGPSTLYYGGNTSCVEFRVDDQLMILDAGTGIRSLGLSLEQEFKDQPISLTLLITHTHWDHIQGFPFFPVAYNPNNNIRVLAFEGARKNLEATLSSQMESPYFPISMLQMPGNILVEELKEKTFKLGRVRVDAMFTNHPGICACYKLTTEAGLVVYIPDNELLQRLRTTKAETSAEKREAEEFARARDQKLCEFIRDADIVMMDCQYDCTEYPRFVGWGHSCVDDSIALAVEANVKRFFLFHHDPSHDDAKITAMVEDARALVARLGGKFPVEAAREGLEVVLKAAE